MSENARVLMTLFTNQHLSGGKIPQFQQLYPTKKSLHEPIW